VKGVPKEKWKKVCRHRKSDGEPCNHEYNIENALAKRIIVSVTKGKNTKPYIDGDGIERRYSPPTYKWIETGLDGINYKDIDDYEPPKILIRQARIGLIAIYDEKGALCP
jgi:hypothetical protein